MKKANYHYKEYGFEKQFSFFFEKAWEFRIEKDPHGKPWRFLPDYLPSIVIRSVSGEKTFFLKGPHTKRVTFPSIEDTVVKCIRLYPFVVNSLFDVNCTNIKNEIIPLESLPVKKIDLKKYFIGDNKFVQELSEFGSALLFAKITPNDNLINGTLKDFICCKGNLDYSLFISGIGISERQFQRRFKNETGLSAREFLRILKIIKLASDIVDNDFSDRGLFYDYGYFDRPHFNRTFKEIFGVAPFTFLNRQKTITYDKFIVKES